MAKTLSEKSRLIREAITAHPNTGNTDLAEQLGKKHSNIEFKPGDVANQRTALKKLGSGSWASEEEDDFDDSSFTKAPPPVVSAARATPGTTGTGLTMDDLATLRSLVNKAGGVEGLIKWLEMIREIR
jgi:hypothetical protein